MRLCHVWVRRKIKMENSCTLCVKEENFYYLIYMRRIAKCTWACNFCTSWFKSSFVFFKLSEILFEKASPEVVGIGVAERGGLGLLEKWDTDLELTLDGATTGLGTVRLRSRAVDKTTSFSYSKEGGCEGWTSENVSPLFLDCCSVIGLWWLP